MNNNVEIELKNIESILNNESNIIFVSIMLDSAFLELNFSLSAGFDIFLGNTKYSHKCIDYFKSAEDLNEKINLYIPILNRLKNKLKTEEKFKDFSNIGLFKSTKKITSRFESKYYEKNSLLGFNAIEMFSENDTSLILNMEDGGSKFKTYFTENNIESQYALKILSKNIEELYGYKSITIPFCEHDYSWWSKFDKTITKQFYKTLKTNKVSYNDRKSDLEENINELKNAIDLINEEIGKIDDIISQISEEDLLLYELPE